ncbi:hypothetical protein EYF80_064686 [Liparis tanakae]|uniref:Uncharacterized protein n=1 Tax=Liparis tanakae TaxID=230148 RepID=A0A4Z2E9I8_9TELE|nr:hypothetical protein EYF80_064686 [Liparis tanakae]
MQGADAATGSVSVLIDKETECCFTSPVKHALVSYPNPSNKSSPRSVAALLRAAGNTAPEVRPPGPMDSHRVVVTEAAASLRREDGAVLSVTRTS